MATTSPNGVGSPLSLVGCLLIATLTSVQAQTATEPLLNLNLLKLDGVQLENTENEKIPFYSALSKPITFTCPDDGYKVWKVSESQFNACEHGVEIALNCDPGKKGGKVVSTPLFQKANTILYYIAGTITDMDYCTGGGKIAVTLIDNDIADDSEYICKSDSCPVPDGRPCFTASCYWGQCVQYGVEPNGTPCNDGVDGTINGVCNSVGQCGGVGNYSIQLELKAENTAATPGSIWGSQDSFEPAKYRTAWQLVNQVIAIVSKIEFVTLANGNGGITFFTKPVRQFSINEISQNVSVVLGDTFAKDGYTVNITNVMAVDVVITTLSPTGSPTSNPTLMPTPSTTTPSGNATTKATNTSDSQTENNTIGSFFNNIMNIVYVAAAVGALLLIVIVTCCCCCCRRSSSTPSYASHKTNGIVVENPTFPEANV